MDKCKTCIFRYNCSSDDEYYCTRNNYRLYVKDESKDKNNKLTNYDKLVKCTPEQLLSAFYNLKNNAIYADGELLNIKDNPKDFLRWLNKESDCLDSQIFKIRTKRAYLYCFPSVMINADVPFWYEEEDVIPLFKEKTGVEYLPGACFIDIG